MRGVPTTVCGFVSSSALFILAILPLLPGTLLAEELGDREERIVWSSDAHGSFDLWLMRTDGTEKRRLTTDPADEWSPMLSPDGRSIAYDSNAEGQELWIHDLWRGESRRLTALGGLNSEAVWSPDGSTIYFQHWGATSWPTIYRVDSTGHNARPFGCSPLPGAGLGIYADGSRITFYPETTSKPNTYDLWTVGVEDCEAMNVSQALGLTGYERAGGKVPCSRAGWMLVTVQEPVYVAASKYELWALKTDGSEEPRVLIAQEGSRPGHAMWSPDATRILFDARFDAPYPDIYTMNADGTDTRRLTDDLALDLWPHWGSVTPPPLEGRAYTLENFDGLVSVRLASETACRSGSVCLVVDPERARVVRVALGRDLNGFEPPMAVHHEVLDEAGTPVPGAMVIEWAFAAPASPGVQTLTPGLREVAQVRLERLAPCRPENGISVSFVEGLRLGAGGPWMTSLANAADGTALEVLTGKPLVVPCSAPFHRGDVNVDGDANLTDFIVLLDHLFRGGDVPSCLEAADVNDDGDLNLTDGVRLLHWLFQGGPEPPFPGPPGTTADPRPCGYDLFSSPSALGCESYWPCEG